MSKFLVTYELKSFYNDETYNLIDTIEEEIEADDLDHLLDMLDNEDIMDEIDDISVINLNTDETPIEVEIEYILIKDSSGKEIYKD